MAPCNQTRRQKRALIHSEITRQATRIALQTISAFVSRTPRRSHLNPNSLGYLPRYVQPFITIRVDKLRATQGGHIG